MQVNDYYGSQMEIQQRVLGLIQQGQGIIFKRIVQALSKYHRAHFPHISETSLTQVSRTILLAALSPKTAKDEMGAVGSSLMIPPCLLDPSSYNAVRTQCL